MYELQYRGISLLSLLWKAYAKWLKRKCLEIVELKLEDGQYGFWSGSQYHGPNLHSEANLREILGVCQRSLCMLCRSYKNRMTESLGINFRRFCRSMALIISYYVPLSDSTADRRFVFG